MALRAHALTLAVALAALSAGVCATSAAAERPPKPVGAYHGCAGNTGKVAGTGGIYYLRARGAGCKLARRVVRRYHAKRARLKGESQAVDGFSCSASYTKSYEGLRVSCRRPNGQSVGWTAYLVQ